MEDSLRLVDGARVDGAVVDAAVVDAAVVDGAVEDGVALPVVLAGRPGVAIDLASSGGGPATVCARTIVAAGDIASRKPPMQVQVWDIVLHECRFPAKAGGC